MLKALGAFAIATALSLAPASAQALNRDTSRPLSSAVALADAMCSVEVCVTQEECLGVGPVKVCVSVEYCYTQDRPCYMPL
jgi:hypothetical protein